MTKIINKRKTQQTRKNKRTKKLVGGVIQENIRSIDAFIDNFDKLLNKSTKGDIPSDLEKTFKKICEIIDNNINEHKYETVNNNFNKTVSVEDIKYLFAFININKTNFFKIFIFW